MTATAPPRRRATKQDRDLEQRVAELEALIEEARTRARRRRHRIGAAVIIVGLGAAVLLIGFGQGSGRGTTAAPVPRGGAAARGTVVITMRGFVRVARTLRSATGPVRYREAGRFRIVWRVPASALARGRTFRSTSAMVTGTTSAIEGGAQARSCHGTLTAGRNPVLLRVVGPGSAGTGNIGVIVSPNPVATATSVNCPSGVRAAHWAGSPTGAWIDVIPPRRDPHTDWWEFNHIGLGFYPNFTPLPKGGNSEGWIQGRIPGGYLTWLAVARMHKAAAAHGS